MLQLWYYFKRRTPQTFKPVILVTGCASGIGFALAKMFYGMPQYRVVATARRQSLDILRTNFQETENFWIRPLDVTVEEERIQLVEEVTRELGGVNILINNAGISYRAVVEHMTEQDEILQMKTNYLGPVGLIRLVLPVMRDQGRGKIINISSVSGMLAMPTMASYSASKYALEGMSEALWYEAKPFGIDLVLVQPGFIHSNSFKKVYHSKLSQDAEIAKGPYGDYYSNMTPFVEKLMGMSRATPEKIAKIILKVIKTENPPLWVPATLDALLFYYIRRILPRRLVLPFLFAALPRAKTWGQNYTKRRSSVKKL